MSERLQIKGGAGEYEAAALAAVVSHVLEAEKAAMHRRPDVTRRPSAWVRSVWPQNPDDPLRVILPDHRGDPL